MNCREYFFLVYIGNLCLIFRRHITWIHFGLKKTFGPKYWTHETTNKEMRTKIWWPWRPPPPSWGPPHGKLQPLPCCLPDSFFIFILDQKIPSTVLMTLSKTSSSLLSTTCPRPSGLKHFIDHLGLVLCVHDYVSHILWASAEGDAHNWFTEILEWDGPTNLPNNQGCS